MKYRVLKMLDIPINICLTLCFIINDFDFYNMQALYFLTNTLYLNLLRTIQCNEIKKKTIQIQKPSIIKNGH